MIRENSSIARMVRGVGRSVRRVCTVAVAAPVFIVSVPAGVVAEVEPYCPPVSRQAHQIYDIQKWCASVNGDLEEGRIPNLGERLEQSRRKPTHASPTPQVRNTPASGDAASAVKQPEPERDTRTGEEADESRKPGESARETDRAPAPDSDRDGRGRGGRQQGQREDGVGPSAKAIPTPVSSTPAPSASPSGLASSPSLARPPGGAERPGARPAVMGPLGAALVFGLMVMATATVLIGRLRVRAGRAGAGSSGGGVSPSRGACPSGADGGEASAVKMATAGAETPAVMSVVAVGPDTDAGDMENLEVAEPRPGQPCESTGAQDATGEAAAAVASAGLDSSFVAAPGKAKAEVLGVLRLTWAGTEVSFGRAEARDVFALLSTSRDGVSAEGIVEALWPGDGERGGRRLESAVREINQAMRQATGRTSGVRFVVKSGERRLLPAASFDVDFWRFEDACKLASTAVEDAPRVAALYEVLELYRGPLLSERDDLWVLPVRQAAQRQAVDAAERLAELVRPHDPDRALDVLRLAVERIDPHSEVLWCLLMSIQGELGRLPAVRRSFELLTERLAEIDAAPSAQARQVYERLIR